MGVMTLLLPSVELVVAGAGPAAALIRRAVADQLDQFLGADAEPPAPRRPAVDVLLGKLLAAQLDQPIPGTETTNIPMPLRFSSMPSSTSRLMPLAAVAGLIR